MKTLFANHFTNNYYIQQFSKKISGLYLMLYINNGAFESNIFYPKILSCMVIVNKSVRHSRLDKL